MIFLRDEPPRPQVLEQLRTWQAEVDEILDYSERVAAADERFNLRNRAGNQTFAAVRGALLEMCGGSQTCVYCEDNRSHQIDHVRPRSLHPEHVFAWLNMLWVCGDCNNRKLAKYAVVIGGELVPFRRKRGEPLSPPPAGPMALLDPRVEDPMAFMILDLADTFQFVALPGLDTVARARVEFTINEVLGLNDDPFPEQRIGAYLDFRGLLSEYLIWRARGESEQRLDGLRARFARRRHQTVWREIQRQIRAEARPPELDRDFAELFEALPEALAW
jgi:5-methylcytosine-specific restriction endonuclease McrA